MQLTQLCFSGSPVFMDVRLLTHSFTHSCEHLETALSGPGAEHGPSGQPLPSRAHSPAGPRDGADITEERDSVSSALLSARKN